jgi:hypothetical protein
MNNSHGAMVDSVWMGISRMAERLLTSQERICLVVVGN